MASIKGDYLVKLLTKLFSVLRTLFLLGMVLAACAGQEVAESLPTATHTSTAQPSPTNTAEPTHTPTATQTATPEPTATPQPTDTPTNTPTPEPTATAVPTEPAAERMNVEDGGFTFQ